MAFVFSYWYIVLAVLLLAVIGLVVTLVAMDKKDRVLINEFIQQAQADQPAEEAKVEAQPEQPKANE